MSKTLAVCLLCALLAGVAAAQTATVKKGVNLRADATTRSQVISLLKPGVTLTFLSSATQNGFFHVKTGGGTEGWVWARNVSIQNAAGFQANAATAHCDGSLWNYVYNPQRLIVKQHCIAVTGTFVDDTKGKQRDGVRHEADGDTHGWLDPQFKNLVNAGNLSDEGGNLVFEIVCKYHVTQTDAIPSCSSYHATVQLPPIGSHVRIIGTYVQDTNHSHWMEIHPVTSVEILPQ